MASERPLFNSLPPIRQNASLLGYSSFSSFPPVSFVRRVPGVDCLPALLHLVTCGNVEAELCTFFGSHLLDVNQIAISEILWPQLDQPSQVV